MSVITCPHQDTCSGCDWLGTPYSVQLQDLRENLLKELRRAGDAIHLDAAETIPIHAIAEAGLRDRVDLTWQRQADDRLALGLYHRRERGQIVGFERCPQMSEPLAHWFQDFKSCPPPFLQKGSVRLRVAPDGQRGAWLDLAHADVKALLDEKSWLRQLLSKAVVEIGQKHKPLTLDESGELKLSKRVQPRPWFETFIGRDLQPLPLYGTVASFTQPSRRANRILVQRVLKIFSKLDGQRVFELFSGLGNFTFPIASLGFDVVAFEVDPVSQWSFQETLKHAPDLKRQLTFVQKNLYQGTKNPLLAECFEILFVDPPRSGLKNVIDWLAEMGTERLPKDIVYVSCFTESLAGDHLRLQELGYQCLTLEGVDQFPQSAHCEWVAHLTMSKS